MRRPRWCMWSTVFLAGIGVLAGCTPGGAPAGPTTSASTPGSTGESTPDSVTPSITRELPPEQRRELARIPTDQLCGLLNPQEIEELVEHPVKPGTGREIASVARGCTFEAPTGVRSVLIGVQQPGYGQLGTENVQLGPVPGTKQLHANDCTVYADVAGATLQIGVSAAEADSDQCDSAQAVAQYVLPALVR